jgi:hypothetical protein
LKDGTHASEKNVSEQQQAYKPGDQVLVKTDRGRIFLRLDRIGAICSIGGNYTTLMMDGGETIQLSGFEGNNPEK